MKTVLYLLRHAATAANLMQPPGLQGRRQDPPLADVGIRQAERTRDLLAGQRLHHCYCSPLRRAVQTAAIVAAPHGLTPQPLEALIECDVGRWEGLPWQTIRQTDAEAYERFLANPAEHGYPEGESFAEVHQRVAPALDELLHRHAGETILVVTHRLTTRTYLAGLLGLPIAQARRVHVDNGGVSVVVRDGDETLVRTVNAILHLDAM
jgi:broad specificity phosphatase PhoE